MTIAIVGSALVGKHTLLRALSDHAGGRITSRKERIETGFFIGLPTVILSGDIPIGNSVAQLSCVSGNAPVEASLPLLKNATSAVFVFDAQPDWYNGQRDVWETVRPFVADEKWAFVISKRDRRVIDDIPAFLRQHHAPPEHGALHLSLLDSAAGKMLYSFLCDRLILT